MTIVALSTLAKQIDEKHLASSQAFANASQAFAKGIQDGYECGKLLLEAKATVPHGQWTTWLEANCVVGKRMAQNYMKLAQEYTPDSLPDGSLREALADLAKPKTKRVALLPGDIDISGANRVEVKLGDVWQLGKHLLYCMDSSLWRPEERAVMAFADPPYNVGVADWDKGFEWDHDWLEEFADYVLVTPGNSQIISFGNTSKMKYRWMLNCDLPGVYGRKSAIGTSNTLPVLLFSQLASVHRGINDRYSCTYNQKEKHESNHPGRKPKAFIGWLMQNFTAPGDLVIDPFLGSGTTLLVAETSGRICHGAELNPVYCAEIIARWEALTGQTASLKTCNPAPISASTLAG